MKTLRQAAKAALEAFAWNDPAAEHARMRDLREALATPEQEPHGWMIEGAPTVMHGAFAELDAKAEAKRIGGTCKAYPVYREQVVVTEQEPVAWMVYVAEHSNQYCVDDIDDAQLVDDCTNHNAQVTPLYAAPPDIEAITKEPDAIGCKCSVCGEWQRWTPSGMCCKNGHGGAPGINQKLYTVPVGIEAITKERDEFQEKITAMCKAIPNYDWSGDSEKSIAELAKERDAFAVDLAKSEDYAKSEYLLREKLEEERDSLAAEVVEEKFRKTLLQQLYEGAVEECDEYEQASNASFAATAKLALDAALNVYATCDWYGDDGRDAMESLSKAIDTIRKANVQ